VKEGMSNDQEPSRGRIRRKRLTQPVGVDFSPWEEMQSMEALVELINGGLARIIAVKIAVELDSGGPQGAG
jgi:hypothetical protein